MLIFVLLQVNNKITLCAEISIIFCYIVLSVNFFKRQGFISSNAYLFHPSIAPPCQKYTLFNKEIRDADVLKRSGKRQTPILLKGNFATPVSVLILI